MNAKKMIRWSYVKTRAAVLLVLWVFFAFAFDPLLRMGLETAGSKALGAKVEIGSLHTKLFPPTIIVSGFQAASPSEPMKNLVEFGAARFQLEGRPLLEKKIIVRACDLTGLAWATPRKKSGALRKATPSPAAEKLKRWASEASSDVAAGLSKNLTDAKASVQKLEVDPKELSSLQLADKLQAGWPASFQALGKRIDAFDVDGKTREIQALADQASKSGNPIQKIKDVQELQSKARDVRRQMQDLKKEVDGRTTKAREDISAVQSAKKKDFDALLKKFKLPTLDAQRLSAYLIGPAAASRAATVLRLVEAARERMPAKSSPPPAKPSRMRGLTVEFPKDKSWPAFLLRRARIAGTVELNGPLDFNGEAANFTSNPPLVGKPATLRIGGRDPRRAVSVEAVLDHTADIPEDKISFNYSGLPVPEMKAGDVRSLAVTIGPGLATLSGTLELNGNALRGTCSFRENNVTLEPAASGLSPEMGRMAEAVFRGIKEIQARITLGGTLDNPEFSVASNLGAALASGLEAAVGGEVKARAAALQTQMDRLVQDKMDAMSSSLADQNKALLDKIGIGDKRLNELQNQLAQQLKLPVPKIPGLNQLFK